MAKRMKGVLPEGFLVRIPDFDHRKVLDLQLQMDYIEAGGGLRPGTYRALIETTEPLPLFTSIHWPTTVGDEWVVLYAIDSDGEGNTLHELAPMTERRADEGDEGDAGDGDSEDEAVSPLTHTTEDPDELHVKYRVFREPEGAGEHPVEMEARWIKPVEHLGRVVYGSTPEVDSFTFVLKPDTDHHARVALAAYAASVRPFKPRLAEDLLGVLELAEWDEENGKAW